MKLLAAPYWLLPAIAFLLGAASVAAAPLPENGTYCRDSGKSVFSFTRNKDGSLEFNTTSATKSGDSVLSYYGHAKKSGESHWLSTPAQDDPSDKCRVNITYSGSGWSIQPEATDLCGDHHGAHGPYEMPIFPASSYVHAAGTALQNEDCRKAAAQTPAKAEAPTTASEQTGGPADLVKTVIGMDRGGWGTLFAEKPTALMARYFTSGFNRSWANAMTHNQKEPVLDGDPITGYQMLTKVTLKSANASETGDRSTVTAHVLASSEGSRPEAETIVFALQREGDAWKIDDITDQGRLSLRAYFRSSYGKLSHISSLANI